MSKKRILALIITSPVWLLAGFFGIGVCIFMGIGLLIALTCEYAFTGRWDF